jgi:O-succinylbenzoic acid--CoA ligase
MANHSCPTVDFLHRRAAVTPERTTLIDADQDREWTAQSLDRFVDNVATRIAAVLGLFDFPADEPCDRRWGEESELPGPRIACVLPTGVPFVVTFYAAMRLGALLVPLHTELSETTLENRIERTEPDLLVRTNGPEPMTSRVSCPTLSVEQPENGQSETLFSNEDVGAEHKRASELGTSSRAQARRAELPTALDPDQPTLIVFTSGTTGEPKGVRITPRNLFASATASALRLGLRDGDRWLCCLPPYHMGGLAPVVRTVVYGTTLVLQAEFGVEATPTAMARHGVTGISLVPTQLRRLLDAGWSPTDDLRTVLLGGAPASKSLLQRAIEADVPVAPTYGLTETTSQVATARPDTVRDGMGTVGPPLYCTEVSIIDEGSPVGPEERGEIVVRGPTVTPGYLDEGRTRQAFGEYGLSTGDVGYRDQAGRVWVLGRADEMILTGGELVAPAEVTSTLEGHPNVEEAAVVGLADEQWGQRVSALVTTRSEVSPDELRGYCRDRLAGFKLPKSLAIGDKIPRTQSGTVDREAVRERLREEPNA